MAVLCATLLVVGATGAGVAVTAGPVDAQQRRVVVLGDSVVLGAGDQIVAQMGAAGWQVVVDATVNRSTRGALDAVAAHRAELTDTLVLSFGANDAGDPGLFRSRVRALLDAVAGVPHVHWLTLREVRDYYATANQILREEAAARPNVSLIDWHGATAADPSVAGRDGLHLSPSGARVMAFLIAATLTAPPPPPPPPPAPALAPPTTAPPTTAPPATPARPTASSTTESSTTPPTSARPSTTGAPSSTSSTVLDVEELAVSPADDGPADTLLDAGGTVGLTLGAAMLAVLGVLAVCGIALGAWALAGARPPRGTEEATAPGRGDRREDPPGDRGGHDPPTVDTQ